jgi:flagellar hook-associated protein 2
MASGPLGAGAGSPLTIGGLSGSGLNVASIISALMTAERQPATRMTVQSEKLAAAGQELQSVQSSLRALALATSNLSLPSLFESAQTAVSSEPSRATATVAAGAGVGGHEIEVHKLANSAQRTFRYTAPAAEDTLTIDGRSYTLAAGATAQTLAAKINSDAEGTVYAAALEGGEIVLSRRATGAAAGEYIKVADPGKALTEVVGSAREGVNAEYTLDGVAGTSASNTVSSAIPGVTLTLLGVTRAGEAVTVDVQPPQVNAQTVEKQLNGFVTAYNHTLEALQRQLTTKPLGAPRSPKEYAIGTLFGDNELSTLVAGMRQSMYEPIAGLPAQMSSPASLGITTGAASAGGASQGSIEGLLQIEPQQLAKAVQAEPAAVQQMLVKWSTKLQAAIEGVAGPGGTMEARINGDSSEVSELHNRVAAMDEVLLQREKSLQQTYAQLEALISESTSRMSWLSSQSEGLQRKGL